MMTFGSKLIALSAVLAIGACTPVIRTHGYTPQPEDVAEIQAGADTRGSVRRKIGRPGVGGVFTNDGWYYVSTKVEHYLYYEPEVVDREVVAVVFDASDVVASVNAYGLDQGRIVDLETRTTPTQGRELTIIQQLLGNLGAISADSVLGGDQ